MHNKHLLYLVVLGLGLPSAAAAQPSQKSLPGQTTAPTAAGQRTTNDAIIAAQRGDVPAMTRLKGSQVTLQGKRLRTYRDTKAYRDFVVLTGPDFKLAGTASGVEILIRVPTTLQADKLPDLIDASGTLTDFESRPEGDSLQWMPVITVNLLR